MLLRMERQPSSTLREALIRKTSQRAGKRSLDVLVAVSDHVRLEWHRKVGLMSHSRGPETMPLRLRSNLVSCQENGSKGKQLEPWAMYELSQEVPCYRWEVVRCVRKAPRRCGCLFLVIEGSALGGVVRVEKVTKCLDDRLPWFLPAIVEMDRVAHPVSHRGSAGEDALLPDSMPKSVGPRRVENVAQKEALDREVEGCPEDSTSSSCVASLPIRCKEGLELWLRHGRVSWALWRAQSALGRRPCCISASYHRSGLCCGDGHGAGPSPVEERGSSATTANVSVPPRRHGPWSVAVDPMTLDPSRILWKPPVVIPNFRHGDGSRLAGQLGNRMR